MDHHSTHITWQFGMTLETFQRATNQPTTIPQVIGPTSFNTTTTTQYTPIRITQHTGHISIQQDYYHLSHKSPELQPTANWHMTYKKPIAFSRNCPQLAYRHCHY